MESIIIIPKSTHVEFDIPEEYVGQELTINYPSLKKSGKEQPKKKVTMEQFWGILSDDTAKGLHEHIKNVRNEWDRDI